MTRSGAMPVGRQRLPGDAGHGWFFYARLAKAYPRHR